MLKEQKPKCAPHEQKKKANQMPSQGETCESTQATLEQVFHVNCEGLEPSLYELVECRLPPC
jgi:hypothetical protein